MNEDWPVLLQTSVFDQVRQEFVKARDDALEQIKKQGSKDAVRNASLQRAWEKLVCKFYEEYRPKLSEPGRVRPDEYVDARGLLASWRCFRSNTTPSCPATQTQGPSLWR